MDVIVEGMHLFQKGGIVMYVLLLCSFFVVYIGAERSMFYTRMDSGRAFANQFYTYMKLKQYDRARQTAESGTGGLAMILRDALQSEQPDTDLCRNTIRYFDCKIAQSPVLFECHCDDGASSWLIRDH